MAGKDTPFGGAGVPSVMDGLGRPSPRGPLALHDPMGSRPGGKVEAITTVPALASLAPNGWDPITRRQFCIKPNIVYALAAECLVDLSRRDPYVNPAASQAMPASDDPPSG